MWDPSDSATLRILPWLWELCLICEIHSGPMDTPCTATNQNLPDRDFCFMRLCLITTYHSLFVVNFNFYIKPWHDISVKYQCFQEANMTLTDLYILCTWTLFQVKMDTVWHYFIMHQNDISFEKRNDPPKRYYITLLVKLLHYWLLLHFQDNLLLYCWLLQTSHSAILAHCRYVFRTKHSVLLVIKTVDICVHLNSHAVFTQPH